jgi:uncharacterized repeat protein (TIGR03943 family)
MRTALVLATLGAILCHTWLSGQVQTLLHPMLRPLVLGGGIVLLGAAFLVIALAPEREPLLPAAAPRRWRRAARDVAVALTAAIAVAAAPQSFSALALANRVATTDPTALRKKESDDAAAAWKPGADGMVRLETVDLLMAADAPDTVQQLDGQRVRFLGQFSPDDSNGFKIVRFLMFCCAADAQPVSVQVDGAPPAVEKMGWVQVIGRVHFPETVPGKRQPRVTLEKVEAIPAPSDKFLY